jgi:hypothetical protein
MYLSPRSGLITLARASRTGFRRLGFGSSLCLVAPSDKSYRCSAPAPAVSSTATSLPLLCLQAREAWLTAGLACPSAAPSAGSPAQRGRRCRLGGVARRVPNGQHGLHARITTIRLALATGVWLNRHASATSRSNTPAKRASSPRIHPHRGSGGRRLGALPQPARAPRPPRAPGTHAHVRGSLSPRRSAKAPRRRPCALRSWIRRRSRAGTRSAVSSI